MRRKTRQIHVGNLAIGGDAPIAVQSMTTTYTRDVESTVAQIHRLEDVGCEIVRVAVPEEEDALAIGEIKKRIQVRLRDDGVLERTDPAEARRKEREHLTERMVSKALEYISWCEQMNFHEIKVSLKSSSPLTAVEAYRRFSQRSDYPLHLGITEAG